MLLSVIAPQGHKDSLVHINGINIGIRAWGDPDHHPVLALHGWLDNAATFSGIAPYLEGMYVVAPDFAGHGLSCHRRADTGYYLWDYAIDMDAFVKASGWKSYSILAHSMGTGVASILCSISDAVKNVVFLDGMGAPFTISAKDTVKYFKHALRMNDMARKSRLYGFSDGAVVLFSNIEAAIEDRRKVVGGRLSLGSAQLLAERDLLAVGSGYRWRHDPRLALAEPLRLTDAQAGTFLKSIPFPLHIMLGRSGLFADKAYDEMVPNLPNGTIVSWYDGGHHFHLENPSHELVANINAALQVQL